MVSRDLQDQFWQGETPAQRSQAVRLLIEHDPTTAQEIFLRALQSNTRTQEAARGLALLGDPEAIPALSDAFARGGGRYTLEALLEALAALEADDALCDIAEDRFTPPALRVVALQALSGFPSQRAVKCFLAELSASSRQRQQLAIETLGHWQIPQASPLLVKRLHQQRQTALRTPILLALARIATDDAIFAIQQHLQESSLPKLREFIGLLAQIPQDPIEEIFETCRGLHHGALSDQIDEATELLRETLRSHADQQMTSVRERLEEELF